MQCLVINLNWTFPWRGNNSGPKLDPCGPPIIFFILFNSNFTTFFLFPYQRKLFSTHVIRDFATITSFNIIKRVVQVVNTTAIWSSSESHTQYCTALHNVHSLKALFTTITQQQANAYHDRDRCQISSISLINISLQSRRFQSKGVCIAKANLFCGKLQAHLQLHSLNK